MGSVRLALAATLGFAAAIAWFSRAPTVVESMGSEDAASGTEADLALLSEQVEALRALAADPSASQQSGRIYDFSIRWGAFVSGRLQRLHHYCVAGELSAAENDRYQRLLAELADVAPLIERFGLAMPHERPVFAGQRPSGPGVAGGRGIEPETRS